MKAGPEGGELGGEGGEGGETPEIDSYTGSIVVLLDLVGR